MKLKQLFCRHKKLSALGIYEKFLEEYKYTKTNQTFRVVRTCIVCKCDKCDKEFEFGGQQLQELRSNHIKDINIDKVFNHELWGKWWGE